MGKLGKKERKNTLYIKQRKKKTLDKLKENRKTAHRMEVTAPGFDSLKETNCIFL